MKQCPYCQANSFGVRELFALDYYHTNECKECGKPVRNDGLRQFLVIPAIIAAAPVGILIFAVVPEVFEPFAFLLFFLLVCLPAVLLAKPVKAEYDAAWSQFDADPANDKVVLYVPENDGDYDVVCMQTETGINFANSLDGNNWRLIDHARMSTEVKRLTLKVK